MIIEILKSIKNAFKYYYEILKSIKKTNNTFFKNLNILNDESTIKEIIENKKSLVRFGDGEFMWLLKEEDHPKFQENNEKLSKRLKEIINSNNENILLCIPKNFKYVPDARFIDKWYWKRFLNIYGNKIISFLRKNYCYGNTNVTRFYMGYRNKKKCKDRYKNIKTIWNNKDITIVEGNFTKMGIGNNLLDNANKIERIICPSKNAFDKYDIILEKIISNFSKETLILLSLGPTATVLAYDLANLGYHAIDIGHIDIEYEWMLKKAKKKISISGKAVNESNEISREKENIADEKYKKEIIEVIQ